METASCSLAGPQGKLSRKVGNSQLLTGRSLGQAQSNKLSQLLTRRPLGQAQPPKWKQPAAHWQVPRSWPPSSSSSPASCCCSSSSSSSSSSASASAVLTGPCAPSDSLCEFRCVKQVGPTVSPESIWNAKGVATLSRRPSCRRRTMTTRQPCAQRFRFENLCASNRAGVCVRQTTTGIVPREAPAQKGYKTQRCC